MLIFIILAVSLITSLQMTFAVLIDSHNNQTTIDGDGIATVIFGFVSMVIIIAIGYLVATTS